MSKGDYGPYSDPVLEFLDVIAQTPKESRQAMSNQSTEKPVWDGWGDEQWVRDAVPDVFRLKDAPNCYVWDNYESREAWLVSGPRNLAVDAPGCLGADWKSARQHPTVVAHEQRKRAEWASLQEKGELVNLKPEDVSSIQRLRDYVETRIAEVASEDHGNPETWSDENFTVRGGVVVQAEASEAKPEPLTTNVAAVIEELTSRDGPSGHILVNILRNWSNEKIQALGQALIVRSAPPVVASREGKAALQSNWTPDPVEWMTTIRDLLFTLGMKEEMSNWAGSFDGWGAAFEWIRFHVRRSQAHEDAMLSALSALVYTNSSSAETARKILSEALGVK
jgi:hypothetical protein